MPGGEVGAVGQGGRLGDGGGERAPGGRARLARGGFGVRGGEPRLAHSGQGAISGLEPGAGRRFGGCGLGRVGGVGVGGRGGLAGGGDLGLEMGGAEVRLTEARAAARDADDRRQRLATRDAELGARIATRADEGLEEHRDETAGRLDEAEARAAAYAADARALARLRSALADARAAARERYLAPVAAELAPLLDLVLDGAEVRLHPTRLLPDRLARQGVEEDLAHLSGGTREQIAILTRLAFARLLARSGRPTPVILDDALVFADDARFARVLAAIGAVAADVQVIVLTCRERAFATLPASRPALRLQDAEAAAAV